MEAVDRVDGKARHGPGVGRELGVGQQVERM